MKDQFAVCSECDVSCIGCYMGIYYCRDCSEGYVEQVGTKFGDETRPG